jgi:addiction module HigA family antidote
MLREEFLKPLGLSQYRLAKAIGVPAARIGEIIAEKRSITADTGLRLSRFFGMSDEFWTGLQATYDREMTRDLMADTLDAIVPWSELSKTVPSKRPAARKTPTPAKGGSRV